MDNVLNIFQAELVSPAIPTLPAYYYSFILNLLMLYDISE
jgi:hypothetical protein